MAFPKAPLATAVVGVVSPRIDGGFPVAVGQSGGKTPPLLHPNGRTSGVAFTAPAAGKLAGMFSGSGYLVNNGAQMFVLAAYINGVRLTPVGAKLFMNETNSHKALIPCPVNATGYLVAGTNYFNVLVISELGPGGNPRSDYASDANDSATLSCVVIGTGS